MRILLLIAVRSGMPDYEVWRYQKFESEIRINTILDSARDHVILSRVGRHAPVRSNGSNFN